MSGITSGVGLFSGIDSASIIDQLLSIEARPKALVQRRIVQLKGQQAAFLDLNSKVGALKAAAASFRTGKLFSAGKATSSDDKVLTATAGANAAFGSYNFIVDRLVSSQQMLSKGFSSRTAGIGATSFNVESAQARLDRDTALADLNGGAGVARGKIIISDSGGASATIDLSKAGSVQEVLDAINSAEGVEVSARVEGGKFVITSKTGANLLIKSAAGDQTAASLGIEQLTATGPTVTGQAVYKLSDNFAVKALNDGNGVAVNSVIGATNYDFSISVAGTSVNVNLGNKYDNEGKVVEAAPQDIGGVLKRMNDALTAAGFADVKAGVSASGNSLEIVDQTGTRALVITENTVSGTGTTAQDLGFAVGVTGTGSLVGKRVLAGMNDTLATNLNGGVGVAGGGSLSITDRTGAVHAISFDAGSSINEILAQFEADSGGAIKATLNDKGTGLRITDTTAGTGNLIISGASAAAMGIETTGVSKNTFDGTNLQHKYISAATTLASLNNGQGLGTGSITVTDTTGKVEKIQINENIVTVQDFIKTINSRGMSVKARINANGDGIEFYEDATTPGSVKLKIEDESGKVAELLGVEGEAKGTGADNKITGSFEKVIKFEAGDSLDKVVEKFNLAGVGAVASIVQDGAGSTPYRIAFSAKGSGVAGRFVLDTGALDLGLITMDKGQNAKVFYGSSDPAKALLVTSSTNTLDKVVPGVSIDLKSPSATPVSLTVTKDTEKLETSVEAMVEAFNTLVERIDALQKFDQKSNTKGALLGDSTTATLRQALFATVQGKGLNITSSIDTMAEVGITIKSGKLELDKEKFRKALETDPKAVEELFTAYESESKTTKNLGNGITVEDPLAKPKFTKLGIIGKLEELANSYNNFVDGILTQRNKTLDNQIEVQNKRITSMDAAIERKRAKLQAQFLAMENTIGRMKGQQNALGSLG